jgi:hypothetical protein
MLSIRNATSGMQARGSPVGPAANGSTLSVYYVAVVSGDPHTCGARYVGVSSAKISE